MESVTTDKPDASHASDDEHLGSSSTANGFSVIHSYLSKWRYLTCLCVTAFQLVHFQTYHSSWWSYISQSYEMGSVAADGDLTSRKELKTADSSGLQQHIVWQCMGELPPPPPPTHTTLTTTKHRASASGKHFTSYFRSVAICNDAVSYALLTSLFARLALILVKKTCTAHTYTEVMGQNHRYYITQ